MQLLLDVNYSNLMTLHVLSESHADSYTIKLLSYMEIRDVAFPLKIQKYFEFFSVDKCK